MIQPHGGKLIDRVLKGAALKDAEAKAKTLPGIRLDAEQTSDVENIATGVFSPLEGFLGEKDFRSVLDKMRLGNGLAWTIPVVLAVDKKTADDFKIGWRYRSPQSRRRARGHSPPDGKIRLR